MDEKLQSKFSLTEESDFLRRFKKKQTKDILRESIYEYNYENASHKRLLNLITVFSKLGRIKELKERISSLTDNLSDEDIDSLVKNSTVIYDKEGKQIKAEDVKGQEVTYEGLFVDQQGNRLSNDEIRQAMQDKKQAFLNTIDYYRKIVKAVDLRYGGRLNVDELQEIAWLESQLQNWSERTQSMAGDVISVIDIALAAVQADINATQSILDSSEKGSKEYKEAERNLKENQKVYNHLVNFSRMSEEQLARRLSLRQNIHGSLDNETYAAVSTIFGALQDLKKKGAIPQTINEEDYNNTLIKLRDIVSLGVLRQNFVEKLNKYLSKPTETEQKKIDELRKAQEKRDAKQKDKINDNIVSVIKSASVMFHLKCVMAVVLLVCLFHLPYDFYVLIRFAAMVVFGVMAYQYYKAKNNVWMVTFGALALLFQPLVKISLDRETWNVVDVVVAGFLLYLLWKDLKEVN